jgi:hypothetical protein
MNADLNEISNDIYVSHSNCIIPLSANCLNIIYVNACSIRNKLDELATMIYTTSSKLRNDVHAIVVAENWLYDSEVQLFNISGYNAFHCNRIGRRGGGVSIYVHETINASESKNFVLNDNNYLLIELAEYRVNLLGIYRSHSSNFSSVTDCFETELSSLKNAIILGDLNINLRDSSSPAVQTYKSVINTNGFFFLNNSRFPTRVSNTIDTIIDHVATDMTADRYHLSHLDCSFSDHKALLLNFHRYIPPRTLRTVRTFIDYRNITETDTLSGICSIPNFDTFVSATSALIADNTSSSFSSRRSTPRKPYVTDDIIRMINLKERVFRRLKRFPVNEFLRLRYRTLRNLVKYKIRISKKDYFESGFSECSSDRKKTWQMINSLISGNKPKHSSFSIRTVNGLITEDTDVAGVFNDYFSEIGKQIQRGISCTRDTDDFRVNLEYSPNTLSEFECATPGEILQIIEQLKPNVSVGYDNISAKFLKRYKQQLSEPICELINSSMREGIFPNSLKIAKVSPIFKSGDRTFPGNYRPISVLSAISKIFETVILKRVLDYLRAANFFNEAQFGFLSKSNTLSATINLMNFIFENIDGGKRVGCLFIDLQKAFDCVDHLILLEKLRAAGFVGNTLQLFRSYFENRKQFVQINGKRSAMREIQTGIAQGSILGATLFLIFINDIFSVSLYGRVQLYADDAVLMYRATDFHTILEQMQVDILRLSVWFSANNISINVSKTNFILFRNNGPTLSTILLNDAIIAEVVSTRYLGLFLDGQLRWEEHLNHVRKRILPMLFALRKTRFCISESVAWQIYYAHIFSHLTYLNPIWSGASESRLSVLRVLQNKAIKIIKKYPWRHPSIDLYSPNILPLSVLSEFNLLLTIFRIRVGMLKTVSLLTEVSQVHSHGTRSSSNSNLYVNFARTRLGQTNVFFRGQVLFNELPANIKNAESISTFKNYIRLMLFERYEQGQRNNL